MKSIAEFLENNRSSENGINFFYSTENEIFISYKDFYSQAENVLGFLQSMGIKENDEVVFQIEDTRKFLLLFWGCVMGKIIPVPVLVGNNDEHKRKVAKIWKTLNNPYLAITEETAEKFKNDIKTLEPESKLSKEFDNRMFVVEKAVESNIKGRQAEIDENDICFIQFSSGSTGDPKGVTLTHKNLLTNTKDIAEHSKFKTTDSVLNWMPLTHDMGLIGCHLSTTRAGMSQIIMPTSLFARRPLIWLDLIERDKVTISCSPNFGYKLVLKYWERKKKREPEKTYDLSSLRLLFNGAEPISYELETEFLDEFEKYKLNRNCMMNVYGLAEASLAVCFPKIYDDIKVYDIKRDSLKIGSLVEIADKEDSSTVKLVEVGKPIGKIRLKIADENGNELPEKTTGYILINGDNVTKGYYNNEEVTQNTIYPDGFLKTGDVGFVIDSNLVVTGRAKDIIFINGQNFYPPDLEKICEGIDSIELNTVAACGVRPKGSISDHIAVFVLSSDNLEEFSNTAWDVKAALQKALGIDVDYVVPIHKMPKTTSGKLQRFALGKKLEIGEYDKEISFIEEKLNEKRKQIIDDIKNREFENKTQEKLFELCAEYVDVSNAKVTDNFSQMGFTSMTMVKLAEKIKAEFGKKIMPADLFAYPTVQKMADFISNEDSLVIRKNEFKSEFINKRGNETVPSEFESEKSTDEAINEFIRKAVNHSSAVIYEKDGEEINCVEIKENNKNIIETFSVQSFEKAKISYYENGYSILVIKDGNTDGLEKYFDIVAESVKARYGDISVFIFNNGSIKAEYICSEL